MSETCTEITEYGPCPVKAYPGSEFCVTHAARRGEITTRRYVAEFVKAEHAKTFVAALEEDPAGWYLIDNCIEQAPRRSRLVAWEGPASAEYLIGMAETVGYHGAPPQGPVAKLNGHPVPRCY